MEPKSLRSAVMLMLIALTLFLVVSLPLTYWLAWDDPAAGAALGLPSFGRLPTGAIVVATGTILIESALMILVVVKMWRIADSFTRGVFFSRAVVAAMRYVGRTLLVIALLRAIVLPTALFALWLSSHSLDPAALWLQIFKLPAAILLCGLFALIMASAFDRATRIAHDARFTV